MAIFTIRELSLRQRLLLLTMVTSAIGVLFGCLAFLLYDLHAARQQKVEELQSTADLIGTNSTAALIFDDASGGSKLLEALRTRPGFARESFTFQMELSLLPTSAPTCKGRFPCPFDHPKG